MDCNVVKNDYQQESKVLFTYATNKNNNNNKWTISQYFTVFIDNTEYN